MMEMYITLFLFLQSNLKLKLKFVLEGSRDSTVGYVDLELDDVQCCWISQIL